MFNTSNITNNQNDSIVLCRQAIQRGLGQSIAYHSTRFDIHKPYRLFTAHPDVPGGLGVVLPGTEIRAGTPMLAAIALDDATSQMSTHEPVLRCGKVDDTGSVHRVVITFGIEGYVITTHGAYNLHTWSPVRMDQIRLGSIGNDRTSAGGNIDVGRIGAGEAITVRITTVSIREPQVGDTDHGLFR
jgi:DNA-directed RNA polymerase beta subunit